MSVRTAAPGLLLAALAATAGVAGRQQATFRASTDVVNVDVSVTSGRNPAGGLGASDFTLLDNGVPQSIDAVAMTTMPIDVTLVTSTNLNAREALPRVLEAMERLRGRLGRDDRISVIDYSRSVHTAVPMQLAQHVVPLDGPASPVQLRSRATVSGNFIFGGASLYDAVFLALSWPVESGRRHLIVLLTDGVDSWSTIDSNALASLASRADAVVHFVMSEPKPDPARASAGAGVYVNPVNDGSEGDTFGSPTATVLRRQLDSWTTVAKMTEQSGGSLHAMTNIAGAFGAILDEFRSSYVLRYTLTGVARAGWHDITVKVTRPGSFIVRARKGYAG